jgi:hypothetical protein
MTDPAETLADLAQELQELAAVFVAVPEKDIAPLVATGCDMIQRSGELEA